MDIKKLPCVICEEEETLSYSHDKSKPEERVWLCEHHMKKLIHNEMQYNERVLIKELIEANFGEVV